MSGKKSKTSERAASIGAATPKDHMEAEAAGGGTVEVTVQGLTIEVDPPAVSGDWEVQAAPLPGPGARRPGGGEGLPRQPGARHPGRTR